VLAEYLSDCLGGGGMKIARRTLGALVAGAVLLPMSGLAGAQQESILDGDSAAISPLIECLKETPTLGVLVLIDMSSSLVQLDLAPGTDPSDERVAASQQAVTEISDLQKALSDSVTSIEVAVRFDGFGASYREGSWIQLDSETAVERARVEVAEYARLDKEILTDYGLALENASRAASAFKAEGCPLVLWFTDGRYDTDNARSSKYTDAEISEITGDELCGAGGPVDRLRQGEVPIIAVGLGKSDWSDNRRENEFSLLRSVVEGAPIPPGQPLDAGFVCGNVAPLGIFEEVRDASTLVEQLVTILKDALFEAVVSPDDEALDEGEEKFSARCEPAGGRNDRCSFNFLLGNYVESFSLYVKASAPGRVSYSVVAPDGARISVSQQSSIGSGIEATRVGSWMWIQGQNPAPSDDWSGTWSVEISDYGPEEPRVIARLFPGEVSLAVKRPANFTLASEFTPPVEGEPGTTDPLLADLEMGRVPLGIAKMDNPDFASVVFTLRVGDVEQISELVVMDVETEDGQQVSESQIRPDDLDELFDKAVSSAWGLEISDGEANFLVFDDELPHTSNMVDQFLWFDESTEVVFEPESRVVDREARLSRDENGDWVEEGDLKFTLERNGAPVESDDRFDVSLDAELLLGAKVVASDNGLLMSSDGSFSISEDVVRKAIEGEGSQLTIRITPSVVHRSTGSTLDVSSPWTGAIGVRADSGLPVYVGHEVADVTEDAPDAPVLVAISLEPPKQGVGSLEVVAIAEQPDFIDEEYSGKRFELGSRSGCENIVPSTENFTCVIELDHSWRGAIDSVEGIELEYRLSGTDLRAEEPPSEVFEVKSFSMERPPDSGKFWGTLILFLLLLTSVQLLVRAIYTSAISRWFAAPLGARHAAVKVRITESDRISMDGRSQGPLQSHDLQFATDLERRDRSATIGGQQLEVNWWKTFVGEPARGRLGWLMRRQEPVVRVRFGSHYVFGSEGFDPPTSSGSVGLMPIGIATGWAIRIPTTEKDAVVNGEPVSGELWFVVDGNPDKSAQVQLDQLLDDLDGAGTRRMTQLRNDLKAAEAAGTPTELDVDPPVIEEPIGGGGPQKPDVFGNSDPFGSSSRVDRPSSNGGPSGSEPPSSSPPRPPSNDPFS